MTGTAGPGDSEESRRHADLEREGDGHPAPELVAAWFEGTLEVSEAAGLRAHLQTCPRCMGLYAEVAEMGLSHRWSDRLEAVPEGLLQRAKDLAASRSNGHDSEPHRPRRPRHRMAGVILAAAAGLIIVAAVALIVRWSGTRSEDPDPRQLATIRAAVREASRTGMVLAAEVAAPAAALRGPVDGGDPSLSEALNDLAQAYEAPGAGRETAYWLVAGMIAEGDPAAATILSDALERFPEDPRLQNLAAVLAYRESRLADAEAKLRRLLASHPRDEVALFNLVVLLREQQRLDEADEARRRLLGMLEPGSGLRERVERESPGDR